MTAVQLGDVMAKMTFGQKIEWASRTCECGAKFEAVATLTDAHCKKCTDDRWRREAYEQGLERMAVTTLKELPPRFRWASFGAPELAQRVKPRSAIEKAKAALDAQTIVLLGPAGGGKTSLAGALLPAMAAHRKTVGRFATSFDIAEARRKNRLGQGEATIIATAMHAGVLLLDEIGAEKSNDLAVDEVIRFRHDNELPSIYTSGFNREDIGNRYGAGVERRIFEGAVVLCLGVGR